MREDGVEEPPRGDPGGAQHRDRRCRYFAHQAQVAGHEGGGLPRARPSRDPEDATPVVDHRLLLVGEGRHLHGGEATEGV
jgi:hypothetical protein